MTTFGKGMKRGSISAEQVGECLRARGLYCGMTPQGFPLPGEQARVVNGSGIAGDNGRWWIVETSGRPICEPCGTKEKLSAALHRWRTGKLMTTSHEGIAVDARKVPK